MTTTQKLCLFISFTLCLTWQSATAQRQLIDDFSGATLDFDQWSRLDAPETEIFLEVQSGTLVMKTTTGPNGSGGTRFRSAERNVLTSIEGDLTVVSVSTGSMSDTARVGVEGQYYNDVNAAATRNDVTGDVWANVRIGDRGNGLEAWWVISRSDNGDFTHSTLVASGTLIGPGTLATGTPYTLRLEYDGDRTFTFTAAGVGSGPQMGPVRVGPPGFGFQQFRNHVFGEGAIHSTIDNADINNGGVTDDFSMTTIDATKWEHLEVARIVENGKLRLSTRGDNLRPMSSSNVTVSTYLVDNPDYIEAQVTVSSDSILDPGLSGRARITGIFYNHERGVNALPYDGWDGDAWGRLQIEMINGVLVGSAYMEHAADADVNTSDELFFEEFTTRLQTDQEYLLWIQRDGDTMIFGLDDETIEYQIKTPTYEPSPTAQGGYRRLSARLQGSGSSDPSGADGVFKAFFDNVYVVGPATIAPGGVGRSSSSSPLGLLVVFPLALVYLIRRRFS